MVDSMRDSFWRFVTNLQSQMSHLQFDNNFFPQLPKFNQQDTLNAEEEEEDEDEDDDEELGG